MPDPSTTNETPLVFMAVSAAGLAVGAGLCGIGARQNALNGYSMLGLVYIVAFSIALVVGFVWWLIQKVRQR